MTTRIAIELIIGVAFIIGFIFEEKIALFERKMLKKIFAKSINRKDRENERNEKLRTARFLREQQLREQELLELGCDLRPNLRVIKSADYSSAIEEVA